MGSTGNGTGDKGKSKNETLTNYGITGTVPYKGKINPDSKMDKPGANNVTLKAQGRGGNNVLFQFKLTKDGKSMLVLGFREGQPQVKARVKLDAYKPSFNTVLKTGSMSDKRSVLKLRELMIQSSKVSEDQLGKIAQSLLRKKNVKKG